MRTHAVAYTVKPGDSLWKIARHHYGHGAMWPVIFVYNQRQDVAHPGSHRLVDPDKIHAGEVLHLPTHLDPHHLRAAPGQRAIPGPIAETSPADGGAGHGSGGHGSGGHGSGGHGGAPGVARHGLAPAPSLASSVPALGRPGPGGAGKTLLNDFNIRFDVSRTLLKRRVGQFEVEIQFKGYISLRHDRLIQATSFTNKALENQRKMELGHRLGDLIATRKLKVEWQTGRIEYECLLTTHMSNGKPAPVSTGFVLDKSVPPLAWRTKINIADGQGHWNDIIYRAENLNVTITVRWKPDAKTPQPPAPPAVVSIVPAVVPVAAAPAPAPVPAPAPRLPAPSPIAPPSIANDPARTQDTGEHEGEAWLGQAWHWVEHHPAEVAAAVVVAVVVVAAAPEIAAAVASGALVRGATAALAGGVVTRMATSPGV